MFSIEFYVKWQHTLLTVFVCLKSMASLVDDAAVPAADVPPAVAAPGLMIIEFCSHSVQMLACMWIQTMQPRSLLNAGVDCLGDEVQVVDVPAQRVRGIMDGGA